MDLLELDERLEKNIEHLEKSLAEYVKVVTLVRELELQKNALELYVNQISEAYEGKWKDIQIQNEKKLADMDQKVNEKLYILEEENNRALMKIINAHTVNDEERIHSEKEVTESMSNEVYTLQGKNKVIDQSIEEIKTNITKIKSESERSLINLSSELFKETMRAADKDRKSAKNLKIFMAISSVLYIVLLIWR